MDRPTIDITSDSIDTWYDLYLNKLLDASYEHAEGIELYNYGYVVTKQGVKMIERQGNVVYVKFD